MRDFNHTIGVLVKAYLDNTLQRGDCRRCAVGNILQTSSWKTLFITQDGCQLFPEPGEVLGRSIYTGRWFSISLDDPRWYEPGIEIKKTINDAYQAISSSGYTLRELANIEYTFETSAVGIDDDTAMFNGLMAVVDVLANIHGIDLTTREETKKLFVKETTGIV